jgi:hypothetical protein
MMRIGLLVAGAAALLPMLAANAQRAPSENDIFALYCLGVFRASTETFAQSYASACPTGNERGCQSMRESNKTNEEGLNRTKRYLVARGHMSGAERGIAKTMMFTVRRGEDDGRQCLNWRMNNIEAVLADHEPQFCKQTDKCGDLSRLPM